MTVFAHTLYYLVVYTMHHNIWSGEMRMMYDVYRALYFGPPHTTFKLRDIELSISLFPTEYRTQKTSVGMTNTAFVNITLLIAYSTNTLLS